MSLKGKFTGKSGWGSQEKSYSPSHTQPGLRFPVFTEFGFHRGTTTQAAQRQGCNVPLLVSLALKSTLDF